MIRGIGVDIIEIERVGKAIQRTEGVFRDKVFTENESVYCESKSNPAQHFAARFAAKEAVSKALATGWSGAFRWKDVEVVNEPSGLPRIQIYGSLVETLSGTSIHLSLSHSDTHVVAMVIIEDRLS